MSSLLPLSKKSMFAPSSFDHVISRTGVMFERQLVEAWHLEDIAGLLRQVGASLVSTQTSRRRSGQSPLRSARLLDRGG